MNLQIQIQPPAANTFTPICTPPKQDINVSTSASLNEPIPDAIYSGLFGVSCSSLALIGSSDNVARFKSVSDNALTLDGRLEILYIGGEFCPELRGRKLGIDGALSKFGTFSAMNI